MLSNIFEDEMLQVSVLSQVAFGYLDEQVKAKEELEKFNSRYRDNSFWVNTVNKFQDGVWGDDYASLKMELNEKMADANLRSQMVVLDFKEAVDSLKDKFYGCDFSALEKLASDLHSASGILNSTEFSHQGYAVLETINHNKDAIIDEISNLNKNTIIFSPDDNNLDSEEYLKSQLQVEHYFQFEPYRHSLEKCIELLDHNAASCDKCASIKRQLSDFKRKYRGGSFTKKLKRYCLRKMGFSLRIEKLAKMEIGLKKDAKVSDKMVKSYIEAVNDKLEKLKGLPLDTDMRKLEFLSKKLSMAHKEGNDGDTKKFAMLLKNGFLELKDTLKQREERSWVLAEASKEFLVPGLSLAKTYKILAGNEMSNVGTRFSDDKVVEKLLSLGYKTDEISSALDKFSPNFINTSSKMMVSKLSKSINFSTKRESVREPIKNSREPVQKNNSGYER